MQEITPVVGILVGSTSEIALMRPCTDLLDAWGVAYEVRASAAHRAPNLGQAWTKGAQERGMKAIIASADRTAHLVSMAAMCTHLPVIAVPLKPDAPHGLDALLATIRMISDDIAPAVAVKGPAQAAHLAVKVMSAGNLEMGNAV